MKAAKLFRSGIAEFATPPRDHIPPRGVVRFSGPSKWQVRQSNDRSARLPAPRSLNRIARALVLVQYIHNYCAIRTGFCTRRCHTVVACHLVVSPCRDFSARPWQYQRRRAIILRSGGVVRWWPDGEWKETAPACRTYERPASPSPDISISTGVEDSREARLRPFLFSRSAAGRPGHNARGEDIARVFRSRRRRIRGTQTCAAS
jgi:hypothetical protein